jgi:CRISPR-associated protein Cmr2
MSTTYFALTIGPIYKTLALARKTREIWAASYLFSFLMEQVVVRIKKEGEMVIPSEKVPGESIAGLYPDRLIIKIKPGENVYQKVSSLVCDAENELIRKIAGDDDPYRQFLIAYFQVYTLEITLSDNEDPVTTINSLLDSLEQRCSYVAEFEINYLEKFLAEKETSFLYKEHLKKTGFLFPSLLKIAAAELKTQTPGKIPEIFIGSNNEDLFEKIMTAFANEKDEDQQIRKFLKISYDEDYQFCHNYISIVHADGDNLNLALHALQQTGKISDVQEFSTLLMEFGKETAKMIDGFGGTPIYLGGDDLLFFAPVRMGERTIFHLVRDIDELYKTKIEENTEISRLFGEWNSSVSKVNGRKKVCLSFSYGISISYYKNPMKEALETARCLLFDHSKMVPGKNALTFQVVKHRGQTFGATWQKGWESYMPFLFDFLDKFYAKEDKEKSMIFLTSVQQKLDPLRSIIYHILCGRPIDPEKPGFKQIFENILPNDAGREVYFRRLMDNFFNEEEHLMSREFLEFSFYYLLLVYRNMEDLYGNNKNTAQKAVDTLYATLRFIQFITQPDNNFNEEED